MSAQCMFFLVWTMMRVNANVVQDGGSCRSRDNDGPEETEQNGVPVDPIKENEDRPPLCSFSGKKVARRATLLLALPTLGTHYSNH